jgi:poly [ADP-ribose] polymerase 2/3/4
MIDKGMDIQLFNQQLLDLFKVIPRKMANVKENLLIAAPTNKSEIESIKAQIVNEQVTLDVMRSQVEINEKQAENAQNQSMDLLQMLGLQIETVEDSKVEKLIKLMMGGQSSRFVEAYQVKSNHTQNQFDKWMDKAENKKTQLLWHGSRNENWLSILKSGLVLRPANAIITGKMFGYGVYFANEFSKSLNYSSLCGAYWTGGSSKEAYLAIFEVHTGNQLEISQHENWHTQLTEPKLKKVNKKYDSVFAKRGMSLLNNEFIVYNEAQCTIKYIVKIK